MKAKKWTDEYIENAVANILHYGVLLAGLVVVIGLSVVLLRHGINMPTPNYGSFKGEAKSLTSITGIAKGLWQFRGKAIVELGIITLVATPIARVAYSIVGYIGQKDRVYTAISSIVLAVLLVSILRAF